MSNPRFLPSSLLPPLVALHLIIASVNLAYSAASTPVVLKSNGGWCWFQDERAIVVGETVVFGSIAGSTRGNNRAGDVDVTSVNLVTGASKTTTLHPAFQSDDHDVPALLALPDGRILATYQTHANPKGMTGLDLMRWRRTVRPGDISEWTPEQTVSVGAPVSYSNLFLLGAESGRIYNFHRGVGFNPNYLVSIDHGTTFTYGGRLLQWAPPTGDPRGTGLSGGRPYVKYAQAGPDTVHFTATEDHPVSYDNSLYHAFIRGGRVHHSDGRVIDQLSTTADRGINPQQLTPVFRGDVDHVPWMCDLHIDPQGHPRITFSVQRNGARGRGVRGIADDGLDLRYYYARWTGDRWKVHEIAFAGSRLYAGEDDYAGLAIIDPQNPSTVYLSTNADPQTGTPLISAADGLRHWEIYRGVSGDDGTTFTWSSVTRDSTADNLRPIVPIWPQAGDRTLILWLRGTYRRYTDYDLDVVGLLPHTAER